MSSIFQFTNIFFNNSWQLFLHPKLPYFHIFSHLFSFILRNQHYIYIFFDFQIWKKKKMIELKHANFCIFLKSQNIDFICRQMFWFLAEKFKSVFFEQNTYLILLVFESIFAVLLLLSKDFWSTSKSILDWWIWVFQWKLDEDLQFLIHLQK